MKFLDKLQNLPEGQRKLFVWGVTIVIAVGLFSLWVFKAAERLPNIQGANLRETLSFPEIDFSEQIEEEIQDFQEGLRILEEFASSVEELDFQNNGK